MNKRGANPLTRVESSGPHRALQRVLAPIDFYLQTCIKPDR
ncbi:hypothetical protein [Enterobacter phage vB_ExiM_F5M1E]|nr:hypothetical protein [Enterobacter phage vB_ExiM_F1M1E]UNA03111.1 hypothetical protein [Enterobacter phage vB_ExiM_F2M1E]UNA03432.1 hypothetical protein [Enterobacter phage vB_ExiM_F4M1E]UNA03753.1 hypothetical protein [Enterobacter phage vB_ExiM_F5M1E]UNA04073.1 hypothetical protein [Pantoea phage vB_PdiM_F5M2A]